MKKDRYVNNKIFIVTILLSSIILISTISTGINNQKNDINISNNKSNISINNKNDFDKNYISEIVVEQLNEFKFSTSKSTIPKEKPINDIPSKKEQILPVNPGLMDSIWPTKCHDNRHTSQSQYSTENTTGVEKWRFKTYGWIEESAAIDSNRMIYIGSRDWNLYCLYPNGTIKWTYPLGLFFETCPAIDNEGIIYVGLSNDEDLEAIYPDGSMKWRFSATGPVTASPIVADDGTIYFGCKRPSINIGRFYAINSNGTEKWCYDAGHYIYSDPVIDDNGIIYFGSIDTYLHALYPNGTLKWKFKTGDWINGPPSIAIDGTIYVGSFDDYLYAINPDGTKKWKTEVDWGTETNPAIANDGTIYVGGEYLYAINPDGSIKWKFDPGEDRFISKSSPAISADGTIYIGTIIDGPYGGDIIAVNPDGTERWRKTLSTTDWVKSSPIIDSDGTVYISSCHQEEIELGNWRSVGYLHAFGPGPLKQMEIIKPERGKFYIFDEPQFSMPFGRTYAWGDLTVEASPTIPEEVEKVSFRLRSYFPMLRDSFQQWITYEDYDYPFEWEIDKSNLKYRFCRYNLEVVAYYEGGCVWSEDMDIFFMSFLKLF